MSQLFHLGERMGDHASLKADLAELDFQLREEKDKVLAKEKEIKALKLKVRNQDEAGALAAAEKLVPEGVVGAAKGGGMRLEMRRGDL